MTTLYLGNEDLPKCPACGTELEDPAEDHVVPSGTGAASASSDSCWNCGTDYTASRVSNAQIAFEWHD